MKLLLTEKEAQQVELAALQKLVQDKIQNMIDKRVEEMNRELSQGNSSDTESWGDEPAYTLADIHKKFLGGRSVIDTQSAAKPLLVPAGLKLDK